MNATDPKMRSKQVIDWASRKPRGFWHEPSNRLLYLAYLYKKLRFKSMDDWYMVTHGNLGVIRALP